MKTSDPLKLAIISTHPIQYNAPFFKELAKRNRIQVKVFYTWGQAKEKVFDPGFGKERLWDIPLLEGYEYEFVGNISASPGSHHFKGINNPGLVNQVKDWNPDTILVFGWSFISHLKLLRYFKGKKKILFRGDSNLLDEMPGMSFKKLMRTFFLTWVYRHIDIALYTGTANKAYYLRHGLGGKQLVFAPHAVDNERFKMKAITYNREQFGIPPDAIIFMFCGKFEQKKDPQLLLEVFLEMNDINTHLFMVGSGEMDLMLQSIVQNTSSSLASRIHFLPFQNQQVMPSIYSLCDVFVLPSQGPGETWGLSVNEAMAAGKAILVSDKCGCTCDLIQEGINGYIFKSGDKADLLNKLRLLSADKSIVIKMGEISSEMIKPWSFENICRAIEKVVE